MAPNQPFLQGSASYPLLQREDGDIHRHFLFLKSRHAWSAALAMRILPTDPDIPVEPAVRLFTLVIYPTINVFQSLYS
jgi:hypothetical protein